MRESHDEDEVDADESQQVAHDHAVDHDDEGPDCLEATAEEEEVGRRGEHHHHGEHVLDLVGAGQAQEREREQDAAGEEEHDARWRCHLELF